MISKQDHLLIAGLGIQFAVIMCIGSFGGYYLDKKLGTLPVFILAGSALAFALALYIMVRSAKAYVDKEKEEMINISDLLAHHILDHHIVDISLGSFSFYITQHMFYMFVITFLLLNVIVIFAHKKYGKMRTFLDMFVSFVRDEIAVPNLGEKAGRKLTPFFCTMLIFLLAANYIGMLPGARTITSNISVTGGMALLSLCVILGLSIKENGPIGCLKTFIPGGVPKWLIPLLFPLEIISLIIKVFVLAVRLFANMTAGHIILIGLFSFIFIMGERSIMQGYGTAGPVLAMTLFVSILELLVAAIQAYVFTLLTAIFAGLQMHSH